MNEFDQIIKKTLDVISKLEPEYEKIFTVVRDMKRRDETPMVGQSFKECLLVAHLNV